MTEPTPITIPLINPNEPGALLVTLYVTPKQHLTKGEKLCTLETTKSTVELEAEADGYLVGLAFEAGQTVQAGDILGYLADSSRFSPSFTPDCSGKVTTCPPGRSTHQPTCALTGSTAQCGPDPLFK